MDFPSNTVKWVVIGAGGIARRRMIPEGILPSRNATLTALYSPRHGDEVGRQFGVQSCRTEQELLDQPCDAVYLASPVHLHHDQVIRAARAGKHVLCEKPLGLNPDEAGRMVRACDAAGVKLGVGFLMRFHAYHREALRLVQQGEIGRLVFGRAQLSCWYPPLEGAWRQDPKLGGGGSLMDMACHTIDLLETFFGRVCRVACMSARRIHDYPVEDTGTATLEFESGSLGMIDSLFNVPDRCSKNRLELYGEHGSILAEGTIGQDSGGEMLLCRGERIGLSGADEDWGSPGQPKRIAPGPVNIYRAQIEAFSQAVLDDTPPPINGAHGLWNQRVMAACYESALSGRTVTL